MKDEPAVKVGIGKWYDALGAWYYKPVQTGMGEGGIHDFVGCVPVTITPEMVGKTVGVFVSIEAKEEGMIETLRRQATKNGKHSHPAKDGHFISNRALQTLQADAIHAAHGQAWICDGPDSLAEAHRRWWRWLTT